MAVWGVVRTLPLLLYALCLMQLDQEELGWVCRYIPLCGAAMTALSLALSLVPETSQSVMVANRMAGFFEYPNTFAVFLLAGLVLSGTKAKRRISDYIIDTALIFGVLQSGSRTAYLLLGLLLLLLCIKRREILYAAFFFALAATAGLILMLSDGNIAARISRGLGASLGSSSLLGRLLYWKDALGQILTHPLGLGYQGYYYTQGSFQTGAYSVMYVHNEILQLFLDFGWVPGALVCAAFGQALVYKKTGFQKRLLILLLLAHSMMDFDFQFLPIWFLALWAFPIHRGREKRLFVKKPFCLALTGFLAIFLCWMGTGDFLYTIGAPELCLKVTPFHTAARMERLKTLTEPEALQEEAERILRLNRKCSLAYSALSNAAYASGDALAMIEAKETAIACNRYALVEYEDYLEKLGIFAQLYRAAGDEGSAQYCEKKMRSVPKMLAAVKADTDALAWKLDEPPELELPEEFLAILPGSGP